MTALDYRDGELYLENVALKRIAEKFGTPCYIYSQQTLIKNWHDYYNALSQSKHPFKIHYAVKANSNLGILKLLAEQGSAFDVVSMGEIERVLKAGGKPADIVFAGVGKSQDEINRAIDLGIYAIHVESIAELIRINELAMKRNKIANIAIRVNPNIAAQTHDYTLTGTNEKKFGIEYDLAVDIYSMAAVLSHIKIRGIASHIGSQITTLEPFLRATEQLLLLVDKLKEHNIELEYIDIGGGLGVCYKDETPPSPQEYVNALVKKLRNTNLTLHIEPGRSIVANTGVLLARVEYLKRTGKNNFAIVDAAMNDLMRPALYQSFHAILPVVVHNTPPETYAVVGPICESGDFIAKDAELDIKIGDLLAIKDVGAYGFSMSSNYNSRLRCPEVMVNQNSAYLIRRRETLDQLLQNEIFDDEHPPSR